MPNRKHSRIDDAVAAFFAFTASALVCTAVLVASTTLAPAQTLVLPGVSTNNSDSTTGNRTGQISDYCCGVNGRKTPAQGLNSANVTGMPDSSANSGTTTTLSTSTLKK